MDPVKVRNEVRASILWGEPAASVRDEHLGKGVPADVVEAALREALKERNAHYWKSGRRDLLFAVPCAVVAAVAMATLGVVKSGPSRDFRYKVLIAHLLLLAVALAVGSVFFLVRGLIRLFRGVGSSGTGKGD